MLKIKNLFRLILMKVGYLFLAPFFLTLDFLPTFNGRLRSIYQRASSIKLRGITKLLERMGRAIVLFGKKLTREHKFILGIIFAFTFLFTPLTVYSWYRDLPKPELLAELGNNKSTKILDRNGKLLYEIYEDRKYDPVALEKVPEHIVNATLAIEDDQFYAHNGVRPLSIMRAAKASILEEDLQGGSTITQQLVKNVLLTPERTISRKVKEIVLSYLVETRYSKDEILELYLNNIPYGGTAWGVQSASQKYFGKNVWDLDLSESTLLAGLPSAPSALSPLTNPEGAKQRQKIVLNRMLALGYLNEEEAERAYEEELVFAPQIEYINAPHFVWYVRDKLIEEYGARTVNKGGLTVKTTLDLDLQKKVESIVGQEVERSTYLNISNGAAVVIEPASGNILAYVGSKDYFQAGWGAYDVLTALRQPGSAIKPVTYSLALLNGMTSTSIISDSPITYRNEWETYTPVNYDGKFHGEVTLRQALANSYNVPAVKLISRLGADNMVELAKNMGLSNWETDGSYGVSVTLGGKEVRPLDLANVYATLARGGVYKDIVAITSVKDVNGYELYKNEPEERRAVKEEVAYIVTHILSDYYARLPAFGVNNFLSVPGHTVAVKTGTTDQKRDNWTIGYTPSYVVAVWVGNNDNTTMNKQLASGLSGAAPMWNKIMTTLLEGAPNEKFEVPGNVISKYDEKCKRTEVFIKGSKIPDKLCEDKDDSGDGDKDKDKERD